MKRYKWSVLLYRVLKYREKIQKENWSIVVETKSLSPENACGTTVERKRNGIYPIGRRILCKKYETFTRSHANNLSNN